jgi:plastocyanin
MACHTATMKPTDFVWSLNDHAHPASGATPNLLMQNPDFRKLRDFLVANRLENEKLQAAKPTDVRPAMTFTVHIKNFQFVPETVDIQVGDSVTWVCDDGAHTATRTDAPAFDTSFLEPGLSKTITFTQASNASGFAYFCVPHQSIGMAGHVVVRSPGSQLAVHEAKQREKRDKDKKVRESVNATVRISNFRYNPETVEIQVGDTVTWVNEDAAPHTATGTNAPTFSTGLLKKGASRTIRFDQPSGGLGLEYLCEPHPFMKGRVVVKLPGSHLATMGH